MKTNDIEYLINYCKQIPSEWTDEPGEEFPFNDVIKGAEQELAEIKASQLEPPVKPACEQITRVERAGRQTDEEWWEYQMLKIREHIRLYGMKLEFRPIANNRLSFECAFMKYGYGKKDPAGYEIVSKSV